MTSTVVGTVWASPDPLQDHIRSTRGPLLAGRSRSGTVRARTVSVVHIGIIPNWSAVTEVLPSLNLWGEPTATRDVADPGRLAQAFSAWGSALTPRERSVLGKAVRSLADVDLRFVLQACAQLGRDHDFPGRLPSVARALANAGGTCVNGTDRSRLTRAQLRRCSCTACGEWAALRERNPLPFDHA